MAGLRRGWRIAGVTAALPLVALAIAAGSRALPLATASTSASPDSSDVAPSAIVVRARDAASLDAVAAYAWGLGYRVDQPFELLPSLRVEPPRGVTAAAALVRLRGQPGVLYAEPVYRTFRTADVPSDPLWSQEASYLTAVHAPEAWDIEKGKPGVVVAVLDTGIDLTHPDLQGRIWSNPKEVPGNGLDDDNDGCIDDVHGCAFVADPSAGCSSAADGNVSDDLGHGTFVSGVIAADGNGSGMVGVARGVTVLPVKVLDCQGEGDSLALTRGIIYAAAAGAKIINISLGGANDSAIVREAVRIVHDDYGALIVAAAGNSGAAAVAYPARYPNVLAVGAASSADPGKRASFSAYGPLVGVVAVGEGVIGTVPQSSCRLFLPCINGGPYAKGSGTSFSTPQVAGLAALMLSHRPNLTADAIIAAIKATADAVPPGDIGPWAGAGRINMLQALTPQYRIGAPGVAKN